MITLRRSEERQRDPRRKARWLTFDPQNLADPLAGGFGALVSLGEERLAPGSAVPGRPHQDAEVVTYVREGALGYEDSTGRSGVLHAGEFQSVTGGRGFRHSERNLSRSNPAHLLQIWLSQAGPALDPGREPRQRRFSAAERRGRLCVVASFDGRRGSLRLQNDAVIFSALLDAGQHLVHELSHGRDAWLQLVQGEVTRGETQLTTRDGAGFTSERAVALTASAETELLLLEVGGVAGGAVASAGQGPNDSPDPGGGPLRTGRFPPIIP